MLVTVCSAVGVFPLSLQYGFSVVEKYVISYSVDGSSIEKFYLFIVFICFLFYMIDKALFNVHMLGFYILNFFCEGF